MAKIGFKAPKNKVIPAGSVVALRLFEYEVKESKTADKEGKFWNYINWTCIVEGVTLEDGTETGDYNDMRLWHITSFNPTATFMLVNLLNAVGAEYTTSDDGEIEFDTDDVISQIVMAEVKTEEFPKGSGKEKNAITKFIITESDDDSE